MALRKKVALVAAFVVAILALMGQEAYAICFYWDWCYHGWFC